MSKKKEENIFIFLFKWISFVIIVMMCSLCGFALSDNNNKK